MPTDCSTRPRFLFYYPHTSRSLLLLWKMIPLTRQPFRLKKQIHRTFHLPCPSLHQVLIYSSHPSPMPSSIMILHRLPLPQPLTSQTRSSLHPSPLSSPLTFLPLPVTTTPAYSVPNVSAPSSSLPTVSAPSHSFILEDISPTNTTNTRRSGIDSSDIIQGSRRSRRPAQARFLLVRVTAWSHVNRYVI